MGSFVESMLENFYDNLPGLIGFGIFFLFAWLSWKMKESKKSSTRAAGEKLENGLGWLYIVLFFGTMGGAVLVLILGLLRIIF